MTHAGGPAEHATHSDHHDGDGVHRHRPGGRLRPLAVAVVLTFGYALVELIGGLWSGSLALIADAGHMVTDSAALLFAFAANLIARRPVSDRHSYGLARVEVIAAFVNSLAMLGVVAWIFFEAFHRITAPIAGQGPAGFRHRRDRACDQHRGRMVAVAAIVKTSTRGRRWSTSSATCSGR